MEPERKKHKKKMGKAFNATFELAVSNKLTVTYKEQNVYDLNQFIADLSQAVDNGSNKLISAEVILPNLRRLFNLQNIRFSLPYDEDNVYEEGEDIEDLSPLINRIVFLEDNIEYNWHDRSGREFGDMHLEINQPTGTLQSPVGRYVESNEDGDFLYKLAIPGYLAIMHMTYDYRMSGSWADTVIVILYSDLELTQEFVQHQIIDLMGAEGELITQHLFPHIEDIDGYREM